MKKKTTKKPIKKKKVSLLSKTIDPTREIRSSSTNAGRPTKLNLTILEAFEQVVNYDINAIIFTDEELVFSVNELLSDENKISMNAFKDWKRFANGKLETTNPVNIELYQKIRAIIQKALQIQKQSLFESMRNDDKAWTRWAWIIERKFSDWNLTHKSEISDVTDYQKILDEFEKTEEEIENYEDNENNSTLHASGDFLPEEGTETVSN